jgi:hypothetical protein
MSRKINSEILSNPQKTKLRAAFNEQEGTRFRNITQIRDYLHIVDSPNTYETLRNLYNNAIEVERKKKTAARTREYRETKKQAKATQAEYYKKNVIEYTGKSMQDIYELLKRLEEKSIVVTVYDEKGGDIVKTSFHSIPNNDKAYIDWWKSIGVWIVQKNSQETIWDDYPNAVIYIYEGSNQINAEKIKQYFKEGNVNCLLKPIFAWANECKESSKSESAKSRYNAIIKRLSVIENEIGNNGVTENDMMRISLDAQVDISIEKPVYNADDKYVTESKATKKPLKHFIMRNTKIDHVEVNEFLYLNNIETVSRDEIYAIKKQLDQDGIYNEFSRDLTGIKGVNTLEKTWQLSNEFMEKINEFEISTGLNECYIDDIDNAELSAFIQNGTHYNATVDFVEDPLEIENVKHQDMKNAYANYMMSRFYEGFLGKITDWRKTDKIEGLGLYQINNLVIGDKLKWWNDKMKIFFNYTVYPSPELKWLKENGATFDITYGCWGVKEIDFDMNKYPFLFEKYDGVKGYAKYTGMCDSHYLTKKFSCYGDESLAKSLPNCIWFKNNEITIEYPKKHNYHLGHFTAFITSYQRIQMLDQLINMNSSNLVRVCVDGIYYTGDETFSQVFTQKTKMTFANVAGDSYISNIIDYPQEWNCGDYKLNNAKELYIGEGGNGKTHKNLLDKGLQRVLYLAPSWKLAEKKHQEYGVHSEVWANILTSDPSKYGSIKRRYKVFVID